MASDALEEKINKIRLRNEEIRKRYEEVEADKKTAAEQNALVQLVPLEDWPERKEPPEFSGPPRNIPKQKGLSKEHNDRLTQHYANVQERLEKKGHKFAPGDGPPPDPKYNFLADSEREASKTEDSQANDDKNKGKNKAQRGGPRRRGGGEGRGGGSGGSRDAFFKDNRGPHAFHARDDFQPDYEAWRAERNRIDEARINRQKTAEGNWRREWDNNKVHVEKEASKKNDFPRNDFPPRKDTNNFERKNNFFDNDHSNRSHGGGNRTYHGPQKSYGNQEFRRSFQEQTPEFKRQPECKTPISPTDNRTVAAFDQSITVTVNHQNQPKGPMMSVKVNSPSIAGTGRVGPRQKSRITYYSQQSEPGPVTHEMNTFTRQKSFDEKIAAAFLDNGPKPTAKSPFPQRKKEGNPKSPYFARKEFANDESSARPKSAQKTSQPQRNESKDHKQSNSYNSKPQRIAQKRNHNSEKNQYSVPFDQEANLIENHHNDLLKFDEVSNKVIDDNQEYSLNEIHGTNEVMSHIEVNTNENAITNDNSYNIKSPDDALECSLNKIQGINEEMLNFEVNTNEIAVTNETSYDIKSPDDATEFSLNEIQGINEKMLNFEENTNENSYDIKSPDDVGSVQVTENHDIAEEIENTQVMKNQDKIEDVEKKDESQFVSEVTDVNISEQANDVNSGNQKIKAIQDEETSLYLVSQGNENTKDSKNEKLNEDESIEVENKSSDMVNTDIHPLKLEDTKEIEDPKPEENKMSEMETAGNKITDDSGFGDDSSLNNSSENEKSKDTEPKDSQTESNNESNPVNVPKDHLDKIDTSSIKLILESNEGNSQELETSNSTDATKENREERIESCDINSAASNETSQAINTEESKDKEEILENPTKDNDSNDVTTIVTSSDADTQKPDEEKKDSTDSKEESTNSTTDVPSSN